MRSEPIAMMRSAPGIEADRPHSPSVALRVRDHRLHDVADEGCGPAAGRVKPGSSSQHQTTWSAAASISATL
jgi:hypothetical protein